MSDGFVVRRECLGDALDAAASRSGSSIGWTFEDTQISIADMAASADEVARALLALDVRPGDVVAVWIPNLPEFATCLFACAKVGAVLTAINTRSKLFELEHVLGHSNAKLVIMARQFLSQDFMAMMGDVLGPDAIGAGGTVHSERFSALRRLIAVPGHEHQRLLGWPEFIQLGASVPVHTLGATQCAQRPEQPVLLQYTSGTTALPKGALCSHVYVLNFGTECFARLGVQPGEAVLNTQPFYHVGGACGAVPAPITTGFRFVIPEYYEPERVLRLLDRERCVARTGFAAMYIMEMAHPSFARYDLSRLRSGWCVGPADLMEQVRDRMRVPHLAQLYGATEACGASGAVDDPWEKRSQTCGRPFSGMQIAIFDRQTGRTLPPGEPGEIALRGWCTMLGYLNQPDETAKAIDAEVWVHTGDYGLLDDGGYLHFIGRLKSMIRVGGENVSAEEVEAMLLRHPKIKLAAAIPAPDPRLEEVVCAIVELRDGEAASEQEIIAFCKPRMANFRVPRAVHFTRDWPMTGSGKIQRHVLIERYAQRRT